MVSVRGPAASRRQNLLIRDGIAGSNVRRTGLTSTRVRLYERDPWFPTGPTAAPLSAVAPATMMGCAMSDDHAE